MPAMRGIAGDDVEGLAGGFAGALLQPGDGSYDEARTIWNGAIDRKPAIIARCASPSDVSRAVRWAATNGLHPAVRSGGHGVGGLALVDDGLVIDLSQMKRIEVDEDARIVYVQSGATLGELDCATQPYGLGVPAGIVTHTGVAGLTLGGGIGWLMREHGLTVDNLVSAEVVTAEGELVVASEDENADLLWGLRGGGGNFGIVTSFTFRAHPVGPTVLAGPVVFPLERADEIMAFYRDWSSEVPDALTTILNFRRAPAAPWVPEDLHGLPVILVVCCWAGDPERAAPVVAPLKALGPLVDLCEPKPFLTHQSFFDLSVTPGWHYHWKSVEVPTMSTDVVSLLVDATEQITSPRSYSVVFQLGGAVARVGEEDTAYSHRDAGFAININGVWLPEEAADGPRHTSWVRDLFARLEPFAPGVYVNFLGEEGQDRVRAAYGPAKYDRLAALKAIWDPTNLFRRNQNILPA
jgi:FAD/FMN-containing dehydrogenase